MRASINNKQEALQWKKEFEQISLTTYKVSGTFQENTQKLVFKKRYHCHHNTRPTSNTSKPHSKRTLCTSRLSITVKQKNMKRSKDQYLKKYPCEIDLYFVHNHYLNNTEALRHRHPTEELDKIFSEYYSNSHSPSSAMEMYKTYLQSKHGISRIQKGALLFQDMSKINLLSQYHTLKVENPQEFVYNVQLNRPEKANAMNNSMWLEIGKCFNELNDNADCRVVILSANGKYFTSGIDLYDIMNLGESITQHDDIARKSKVVRAFIKSYQDSLTALEKCDKPVIAAVHNACIGGGVDLLSATDIRYCTKDAWFQLKETDIGMAADVGTLQRMPKIIGSMSTFNELALTARKFDSSEAKKIGFVTQVYETKESMLESVMKIASDIASKSPVGVQMTKRSIIYSRDHTVQEGLDHIADWNQILLQSEDFIKASMSVATKDEKPIFSKL